MRPGAGRQGHARRPAHVQIALKLGPPVTEVLRRLTSALRAQQHPLTEDVVEHGGGRARPPRSPRYRRRAGQLRPVVSSVVRAQHPADLVAVTLVFRSASPAPRLVGRNRSGSSKMPAIAARTTSSLTRAPAATAARRYSSINACVSALASSQAGVRQIPMRGALCRAVDPAARLHLQCRARQRRIVEAAAQDAEVSRLWHCILMPPLNSPKSACSR